jgi:transposase
MSETSGKARVVEANRGQLRLVALDLEAALPEDHSARAVWAYVERLGLEPFYERIKAREGMAGRPAIDPRIFLALWIYATVEGVGSAREIERLSREHLAYQWICGGVNVNHHSLSDFRNEVVDLLNGLLTQSVAMLLSAGLIELLRVAQDGMKVRASAGASSFRTRNRLEKLEKIAREQVETLAKEIEADPGAGSKRQEAARKKAAEDRVKRVERAVEQMAAAEQRKRSGNDEKKKKKKKKAEARTSTTDPEARVMKMADGGFRPAYNVHFLTETGQKVVVAVDVDNAGTDKHAMLPLALQVEKRYEVGPEEWLADGGCNSLENVEKMSERKCKVFAPPQQRRSAKRTAGEAVRGDSESVREWRSRMASEEAKTIYKQRGATAELVNAQCRGQGLLQFLVRGTRKVLAVALLHALTINMRRTWALA